MLPGRLEPGPCFQPGYSSTGSGPWTYFIWPDFSFFFFFLFFLKKIKWLSVFKTPGFLPSPETCIHAAHPAGAQMGCCPPKEFTPGYHSPCHTQLTPEPSSLLAVSFTPSHWCALFSHTLPCSCWHVSLQS